MKVGIGIAHYPAAPGACSGDFCEHAESIIWTEMLRHNLVHFGHDCFVANVGRLGRKVYAINEANVDIALEIHFNGGGKNTKGSETLYCPGSRRGKKLATGIQKLLSVAMNNRNRGAKEGWYKMDAPGVVDYAGDVDGDEKLDYFLAHTKAPAVIIEPDFIPQRDNIVSNRVTGVKAILAALEEWGSA